ncbi:hypothetical protein BGW36DRAFT_391328 [Talaromyces proteolyticus]|uniref:Uncharacterized protein n=1 Tax=Talaromyces proteolyticus TaxID=1131652 RepID=A0AAD4PRT1_9EURO|nr:uncharacterized protein BGW36DRAFT_391328 [Talaromyces proteolyticus]KAH8689669.1 hypothetical protein BGW36DRAFT_391328 [Talaromyces proteolyticus]
MHNGCCITRIMDRSACLPAYYVLSPNENISKHDISKHAAVQLTHRHYYCPVCLSSLADWDDYQPANHY